MAPMERAPITTDIIQELKALQERSGVTPARLLKSRIDVPDGLNSNLVGLWLSGKIRHARAEHLDFVRKAWRETKGSFTITDDVRREMERLFEAKQIDCAALARMLPSGPYRFPNAQTIWFWKDGRITTADPIAFEEVMRILRALPDSDLAPKAKPEFDASKREPLTAEMQKEFERELDRTRVSLPGLVAEHKDLLPANLTVQIMSKWKHGRVKTVRSDLFEAALAALKSLPNVAPKQDQSISTWQYVSEGREPITAEQRTALQSKLDRLNTTRPEFVRRHAKALPKGIRAPMITSWANGVTQTAKSGYVDQVLKALDEALSKQKI